jgi:hypothetical protein
MLRDRQRRAVAVHRGLQSALGASPRRALRRSRMAQYGKAPRHNAGFLALRSSEAFRKSDGKIPEVPRRKTLVRFQGLIPIRFRKCQFSHDVEDCLARFSKPGTGTDERRCGKALGRRMEGSPDSQHGYFESPSARHRSGHRRRRGRASGRESQAGRRAPATPARFGRTLLGAVAGGRPAAPQSTNGRAQPTARLTGGQGCSARCGGWPMRMES